mmetsp:Transcript_36771/g.92880  ORF Transcript_36771/g.92880 Transcript_36771/m.92880 type:complete len:215 (+) Transcript_36771:2371-3015(+)
MACGLRSMIFSRSRSMSRALRPSRITSYADLPDRGTTPDIWPRGSRSTRLPRSSSATTTVGCWLPGPHVIAMMRGSDTHSSPPAATSSVGSRMRMGGVDASFQNALPYASSAASLASASSALRASASATGSRCLVSASRAIWARSAFHSLDTRDWLSLQYRSLAKPASMASFLSMKKVAVTSFSRTAWLRRRNRSPVKSDSGLASSRLTRPYLA